MLLNWFALNSVTNHYVSIATPYAFTSDESIIAIWMFYFSDLLQCVQEPQDQVLSPRPHIRPRTSISLPTLQKGISWHSPL